MQQSRRRWLRRFHSALSRRYRLVKPHKDPAGHVAKADRGRRRLLFTARGSQEPTQDDLDYLVDLINTQTEPLNKVGGNRTPWTPPSQIDWTEVDRLEKLGHGVEFFHIRTRQVVAFIAGFNWLHHPGDKAIVHILRSRKGVNEAGTATIIKRSRKAVELFFAQGGPPRFRSGDVCVRFNA